MHPLAPILNYRLIVLTVWLLDTSSTTVDTMNPISFRGGVCWLLKKQFNPQCQTPGNGEIYQGA